MLGGPLILVVHCHPFSARTEVASCAGPSWISVWPHTGQMCRINRCVESRCLDSLGFGALLYVCLRHKLIPSPGYNLFSHVELYPSQ